MSEAASHPPASSFAPLRQKVFAVLWAATIIGNIGSFMRDVASAWLVTDLSGAPAAVALVQAAATLPIFLLAIPAGVLSDILDRRKFLIAIQILLLFDAFRRGAQAQRIEGLGLGLLIVRQTAELLGLPIAVRTAENEGSTFSIELPLADHSCVPAMEFGAAAFAHAGMG